MAGVLHVLQRSQARLQECAKSVVHDLQQGVGRAWEVVRSTPGDLKDLLALHPSDQHGTEAWQTQLLADAQRSRAMVLTAGSALGLAESQSLQVRGACV